MRAMDAAPSTIGCSTNLLVHSRARLATVPENRGAPNGRWRCVHRPLGAPRFSGTVANLAMEWTRRFVELHILQHWIGQYSGMVGGLSADQRTHPGRILELDTASNGNSVPSL